jgi:hypothetical protein
VAVAVRLVILVLGVTVAVEEVLRGHLAVQRAAVAQGAAARPMVEEVALGF